MKLKNIDRRDVGWLICVLMALALGIVIGTNIQLRNYSQTIRQAEEVITEVQAAMPQEEV